MRVDAPEAGEVAVPGDVLVGVAQPPDHLVEVADEDAGVTLAGRSEVVLDPQVQFQTAGAEPPPPRAASTGGLSISVMPRTPTKKRRAASSSPRGMANCTW